MNIREGLEKIKEKLLTNDEAVDKKPKQHDIDNEVLKFLQWYEENMPYDSMSFLQLYDFIEKMAVWYELRYPNYYLLEQFPGLGQEEKNIDSIMFQNNAYIHETQTEEVATKMHWPDFYNKEVFFDSLPWEEQRLFLSPKYPKIVYVDRLKKIYFELNDEGYIRESYNFMFKSCPWDCKLVGKHLTDVVAWMKENDMELAPGNELEVAIRSYNNCNYRNEGILKAVLYRIISRGGIFGPRRGFLFAKEFAQNIDIPMTYGANLADDGLRNLVNEYIKAGGNKNLVCFTNYFTRKNGEALETITVQELIKTKRYNTEYMYTIEERNLQQRLIECLANKIDYNELKKAQTQQLRLARKLEKSRQRTNNA